MASVKSRVWRFLTEEVISAAFWKLWTGPLAGAGTAVLGYLEGFPWTFVLPAAGVTFASFSGGMLWFTNWRYEQSAEHKLKFVRPYLQRFDMNGAPHVLIGVVLRNDAKFPMQYRVKRIDTSIAARVHGLKLEPLGVQTVDAGEETNYRDAAISIAGVMAPVMPGYLDVEIEYGRKGDLKYQLEAHKVLHVPLDIARDYQAFDQPVNRASA